MWGTSASASLVDSCRPGFQAISHRLTGSQVAAHGAAARNHVNSKLFLLIQAEEEILYSRGVIPAVRGVVDQIPRQMKPSDEKLAKLADQAAQLLQSRKEILDFVEGTARRAKEERIKSWSPGVDRVSFLEAGSIERSVLQQMAHETGWGTISNVRNPLDDPESFRREVLGASQLFFDVQAVGTMHTGSAHLLQWLMITPKLDAEFGPGSAKELWKYLSTEKGFPLWGWMFDRNPNYMRDFRSPRFFYELQLAGENSWFGVR